VRQQAGWRRFALLHLAVILTFTAGEATSAEIVAYWDFNSNPPDFVTTTGTTEPAAGHGAAFTVGSTVTNSFGVLGMSPDPGLDNTSWRIARFPPQSVAPRSSGAQFNVDTSGYQNIVFTWAQRNSPMASRLWRVQYSTDGADFRNHTLITSTQGVWQTFSANFALVNGADNNPAFAVRLVSEFAKTPTGPVYLPANPGDNYGENGTLWLDTLTVSGEFTDPFNSYPTLTRLSSVTTRVDTATALLPFTIADVETEASALQLAASAENPRLIQQFDFFGTESERMLQILPAPGQAGETDVTLVVTDAGGKHASATFRVVVLPIRTPPVVSIVPPQTIIWNSRPVSVAFTAYDLESEADSLSMTVSSTNHTLFPPGSVELSGVGMERQVSFVPAADQMGTDLLSITALDPDGLSTTRSFLVKVSPSQTIAWWNFNSVTPDGEPITGTKEPASGSGVALAAGWVAATIGVVIGSSDPELADNSHWRISEFATQGTSNKQCGVEFRVSTVGYENIAFFWDQRNSDSASRYSRVQYTLNGVTWVDHTVINMPLNMWVHQQSADFRGMPGAENNPNFGVRLVAEFISTAFGVGPNSYVATDSQNNYGPGGTHRFDMVTFHGDRLRPRLSLSMNPDGQGIELSWPADFTDWVLESNDTARPESWQVVSQSPEVLDGRYVIRRPLGTGNEFFRLSR
jgi:hypothetical protein